MTTIPWTEVDGSHEAIGSAILLRVYQYHSGKWRWRVVAAMRLDFGYGACTVEEGFSPTADEGRTECERVARVYLAAMPEWQWV